MVDAKTNAFKLIYFKHLVNIYFLVKYIYHFQEIFGEANNPLKQGQHKIFTLIISL